MKVAVLVVPAFRREGLAPIPELFLVFLGLKCVLVTAGRQEALSLEHQLKLEPVLAEEDLESWILVGKQLEDAEMRLIRKWIDAFRADAYAHFGDQMKRDLLAHLLLEYQQEQNSSDDADCGVPTPK